MPTIASHSPMNISETVRDRDSRVSIENGLQRIKWPPDRLRHVTPKGQTRDPNTLRAQYLESRCYLVTIANY